MPTCGIFVPTFVCLGCANLKMCLSLHPRSLFSHKVTFGVLVFKAFYCGPACATENSCLLRTSEGTCGHNIISIPLAHSQANGTGSSFPLGSLWLTVHTKLSFSLRQQSFQQSFLRHCQHHFCANSRSRYSARTNKVKFRTAGKEKKNLLAPDTRREAGATAESLEQVRPGQNHANLCQTG